MDLQCELSISASLTATQQAELVFTLTNAGTDALQVLNWHTPFEGVKAAMFTVQRDDTEVDYHGRMFKRGAPRKDDYFALEPGERREAKLDLAEGWDVSAPGTYKVEYAAQLFDVAPADASTPRSSDQFSAVALKCNAVSFTRES